MRIALLLAWLCLPAWAGITVDTASQSASIATGTTITWSHSCNGTNRLLFVGYAHRGDITIPVAGITYNGVALTRIRTQSSTLSTGFTDEEIWYLVAPATGAHSIVITLGADISTAGTSRAGGGAISLIGVDQASPLDSQAGREGTSANQSISITTVANGAMILSNIFSNQGSGFPSASGASGIGNDYGVFLDFFVMAGAHSGPVSPGPNTFPWLTDCCNSEFWASAAAFKPAASLAPTNVLGALGGANVAH